MKNFYRFMILWCAVLLFCGCSNDSSPDKDLTAAVTLAKKGEWQEAARIAAAAAEKNPHISAPLLIQALAYEKSGELNKAIDLASRCAENFPEDFTAQYICGRLYSKDPLRQDKAFTTLEKAIKLRKGDVNTLILLCTIGTANNEPGTLVYLNDLVQKSDLSDADTARVYFLRGLYLRNVEHKLGDAFQSMYRAGNYCRKENPELLCDIAVFLEENGNRDVATFHYKRFLALYKAVPDHDPALIRFAEQKLKRK